MKFLLNYYTGGEYTDGNDVFHSFEGQDKELELINLMELSSKARDKYYELYNKKEAAWEKIREKRRKNQDYTKYNEEVIKLSTELSKASEFIFHSHNLEWSQFWRWKSKENKRGREISGEWMFDEPNILTLEEFWKNNLPAVKNMLT